MMILSLLYFIMSNAVANSKKISITYSRSSFITYFFSMLFIYSIFDWYFFKKSISFFNGLIYIAINNLIFIDFLLLLSFLIIILTSFYPNEIKTAFGASTSEDLTKEILDEKTEFNLEESLQTER